MMNRNCKDVRICIFLPIDIRDVSGLRGLEVAFPPHDPSDAGSKPAEVVEFLRTEKFRERSPSEGTFKPFDPCSRFTAR
jgi:hypothetical protein